MPDYRDSLVSSPPISRREALRRTALGAIALSAGACGDSNEPSNGSAQDGRLSARVRSPTRTADPGLHEFGFGVVRDGFYYVPTSYRSTTPAPVALLLHGAGQDATEMIDPIRPIADTLGMVLVAPDSRFSTWDAIDAAFGGDVEFIDRAFKWVFDRVRVDASRVRVVGFSDGASYALSLGLINGDLFSRIVAFSPGFVVGGPINGKPKIFITHGTRDAVLPIDGTSRQIVPQLRTNGYDVEYHEFDGGHSVTPALLDQAMTWAAA
jgi:phospholipase/carboxylesterase